MFDQGREDDSSSAGDVKQKHNLLRIMLRIFIVDVFQGLRMKAENSLGIYVY